MSYLNDKEIEAQFTDICEPETEIQVEFRESGDSGWLQISLPQNEQKNEKISLGQDYTDDDLLDEEKSDSFIIYPHTGKIAFDSWYPEFVFNHLVKAIIEKFKDDAQTKAQKKALRIYSEL